jgi:predicted DNA-binding transcriptional regulator AlpA
VALTEIPIMNTTIRPTDDEWMGLSEFAAIVGKTIDTIYNERARGADFPDWYQFGKKIRMRRSHVDAWIECKRHQSAAVQLAAQTPSPVSQIRAPA